MFKTILRIALSIEIVIVSFFVLIYFITFSHSPSTLRYLVEFNSSMGRFNDCGSELSIVVCFSAVVISKTVQIKKRALCPRLTLSLVFLLFFTGMLCVGEKVFDKSVELKEGAISLMSFQGGHWKEVGPEEAEILERVASRQFSSWLAVNMLFVILMPLVIISDNRLTSARN